MSIEFHLLEESLKDFLVSEQSDSYNARNMNVPKYNNLKISMNARQNSTPHIIITIGISEAMYNLNNSEKMSGGLGSDERYIRKWLDKSFLKASIQEAWKKNEKVKPVSAREDED